MASKKTSYLVFESQQPEHGGAPVMTSGGRTVVGEEPLFGYTCVGAVSARDSVQAVQAIMSKTRRIGRYAVIEAEFINFDSAFSDPEEDRPTLNP